MSEQTQTIDLRFLAESQPSLCIPRIFNNITESKIRQVFDELGLGKISGIDIKERKNEKGEPVKKLYIHFEKWFWNESAQSARRKLISGKEIKIVYDNPWFWKVSASKWAPSHNNYEIGQVQRTERPNTGAQTVRVMNDFEEQRGTRHYDRQERQERHSTSERSSRVRNDREEQRSNGNTYRQRDRQRDTHYERHNERQRHLEPTRNVAPRLNVEPRLNVAPCLNFEPTLKVNPTRNVAPSLSVNPSLPHIFKSSFPTIPKLQLKEKEPTTLEPIRKRSKKNVVQLEIKVDEELEEGEIKEDEKDVEIVELVKNVELEEIIEFVEEMSEERRELLNDLYGDIKF